MHVSLVGELFETEGLLGKTTYNLKDDMDGAEGFWVYSGLFGKLERNMFGLTN